MNNDSTSGDVYIGTWILFLSTEGIFSVFNAFCGTCRCRATILIRPVSCNDSSEHDLLCRSDTSLKHHWTGYIRFSVNCAWTY